jgi:hypothetical protein
MSKIIILDLVNASLPAIRTKKKTNTKIPVIHVNRLIEIVIPIPNNNKPIHKSN